jgi:hypothetical protein
MRTNEAGFSTRERRTIRRRLDIRRDLLVAPSAKGRRCSAPISARKGRNFGNEIVQTAGRRILIDRARNRFAGLPGRKCWPGSLAPHHHSPMPWLNAAVLLNVLLKEACTPAADKIRVISSAMSEFAGRFP